MKVKSISYPGYHYITRDGSIMNNNKFVIANDFDMALFVKYVANQLGVKPKTCWDNYMRKELIPSSLDNGNTAYTREDTNNICLDKYR